MAKTNGSYDLIEALLGGREVVEKTTQSVHSDDHQEQEYSMTHDIKNTAELQASPSPMADLLTQCTKQNKHTKKI